MVVLEPEALGSTMQESAPSTVVAAARDLRAARAGDRSGIARSTGYLEVAKVDARLSRMARRPVRRSVVDNRELVTFYVDSSEQGFDRVVGRQQVGRALDDLQRGTADGSRRPTRSAGLARQVLVEPAAADTQESGVEPGIEPGVRQQPQVVRASSRGFRAAEAERDTAMSSPSRRASARAAAASVTEPGVAQGRSPAGARRLAESPTSHLRRGLEFAWVDFAQGVDDGAGDQELPPVAGGQTQRSSRGRAAAGAYDRSSPSYRAAAGTRARPWSGGPVRTERRQRRPAGVPADTQVLHGGNAAADLGAVAGAGTQGPVWSQRSERGGLVSPRESRVGERSSLRAESSVVNAIARAEAPEDLVRIISDARMTQEQLKRELPGPAYKLVQRVQQMHTVAKQDRRTDASRPGERRRRGDPAASGAGASFSPTFIPVATSGVSREADSGASRVTQLANKLLRLIHLAEVDERVREAQQEVRMSDSKPGESGAGSVSSVSDEQSPNINALKRDVFEAVLRKLEQLGDRSVEDPNGHTMWW